MKIYYLSDLRIQNEFNPNKEVLLMSNYPELKQSMGTIPHALFPYEVIEIYDWNEKKRMP